MDTDREELKVGEGEDRYFRLWDAPQNIAATFSHWVKEGEIMRVDPDDFFTLNICPVGEVPHGLQAGDALSLELCLLFYKGDFFQDEEEYYAEEERAMASESIIPCGTFSPTRAPNFVESATVLLRGKVLAALPFEEFGDKMFKIDLKMQSYVCRVVSIDGFGELGVHPGNILSGFFFVDGIVRRAGR